MHIRIAARQSDLARLQAYQVGAALKSAGAEKITFQFRASLGDVNQTDPLWKMPEKGVFTEDFVRDLIEESADIVVHSWKDLPTAERTQTEIVATLARADSRDLLLFRKDRLGKNRPDQSIKILTSSPRRSYNLADFLASVLPGAGPEQTQERERSGAGTAERVQPEKNKRIQFDSVRGNIPTRLKKLIDLDVDGLIVAKAAIDRLLLAPEAEFENVRSVIREVLRQCCFMVLPLSVNPTAAAQGALAIEVRKGGKDEKALQLRAILNKINCVQTFETVMEERCVLAAYGGGCHQKIGVSQLRRSYGDLRYLRGLTDTGHVLAEQSLIRSTQSTSVAENRCFPRNGEDSGFFDRVPCTGSERQKIEQRLAQSQALWIARDSALPSGFLPTSAQLIWVAGVQTWKKLAARGVWVNGTADGLGEQEAPGVDLIYQASGVPAPTGKIELHWTKLTHCQAADATENSVGTYRLVPKGVMPDLSARTHFFWSSGSQFDEALKRFPIIREGFHACGPGNTAKHLRDVLGRSAKITVYLSLENWRNDLKLLERDAKPAKS